MLIYVILMLIQSQDEFKELARCYLCGKTWNMTLNVRWGGKQRYLLSVGWIFISGLSLMTAYSELYTLHGLTANVIC